MIPHFAPILKIGTFSIVFSSHTPAGRRLDFVYPRAGLGSFGKGTPVSSPQKMMRTLDLGRRSLQIYNKAKRREGGKAELFQVVLKRRRKTKTLHVSASFFFLRLSRVCPVSRCGAPVSCREPVRRMTTLQCAKAAGTSSQE